MLASVRLSLSFLTRKERTTYFTLLTARALTGLLDVLGIVLIGFIASIAASQLSSRSGGAPLTILGFQIPHLDAAGLLWLVIFVLAVFVGKAGIAIALTRLLTSFVARVEGRNAGRIANFLLRGSLDSVKQYSKAEFQYALTGSTVYAFTGLLNAVGILVTEGFLLVVVSAAFFIIDPIAAFFALAYFTMVIVIIQVFIGHSLKRAGMEAVAGTIETTNAISDTMDTFREISVLAKQDLFISRIYTSRLRVARSGATMSFLSGMPRYVVETALILGVVIFVGQQFLTGQLATGIVTIGVFLTGGVRIMASLLPLQSAVASMKQNVEQAALAQSLLSQDRDRRAKAAAIDEQNATVHAIEADHGLSISIRDACYRFPDGDHDILRNISLEIPGGQDVAVIGPSGAGKTTLVDLILGLIKPDAGSVRIGSVEPNELRTIAPGAVSYVPQKPGLVSGSIAENIALGVRPEDIDYDLLREVVASAYLTDFIDTLPNGLATSVGKQVDALSGGQIQRIGVARALYVRPRLLILDEATSGLDAGTEAYISTSLRTLRGAVTVIVIAHRLSTVQHADVVYVVEDGRITASGDFKTVQATVPMVADYVKLMSFDVT